MTKKRTVYRDYRRGHHGEFTTKKKFDNQGPADGIHREKVDVPEVVNDVAILFEYDDYGDDELFEQEYHGTGDTGGTAE